MKISLLRSNSSGISGTLKNINCHASRLKDLVTSLSPHVKSWGFEEWSQGNNIHLLKSKDGRTFVMRPFSIKGEGYVGIRVYARISRSSEISLFTMYHDARNTITPWDASKMMSLLSEPQPPSDNSN